MTLSNGDIGMFLTGGSSNANPNLSLGGNVSSVQVVDNTLNNLFRRITDSEASSGITLYRCVAIKNKNAADEMLNPVFYMVFDSLSNDSLALYSKAVAAKNVTETPIADEFTTPAGTNFIAALNRSGGIKLTDLDNGEFINVWLRYTVQPGSTQFANDTFKMRVEIDNPDGVTPGPTPDPDPNTGVNWSMAALGDCSCGSSFSGNLGKIKARNPNYIVFNGDLAYKSGSQCFIDLVGSTWRGKSTVIFGNHDVDESESQPETKNNLKNAWSLSKTYWKKTVHNAGLIGMESGENQSVSDGVGSDQYNFVKGALEEFKANGSIEWIFVFNHYPFYGPSSNHSNNSGGRDRYDPLWDANGVDAVFTSHNHNLWHSKLLKYNSGSPSNPTSSGTDPNYSYRKSATNHGKIFVGTGAGGKSHYSFNGSLPSYVPFGNDNDYGYVFMAFSDSGKKITFKIYTSSDSLKKTFTLTHT